MTETIQILSDLVIDQIAAGEIIERPASVVKELVENSLDASSTRIVIEIENGGKKLIRITDNGSGMTKTNLELCIRRFATSKILSTLDLDSISTYGFRGEALPSIAAISEMTIKTADTEKGKSFCFKISGGKTAEIEETVWEKGTQITIHNIFFNVPARFKFLKTDATETRKILNWIEAISLAHPQISFSLIHNGKKQFDTSIRKDLHSRLLELYGQDFLNFSCFLSFPFSKGFLSGLISEPSKTRRDRSGIKTLVNGRLVQSKILNFVISKFYKDKLPHGSYPYVILLLEIDPAFLDVNVHPAKLEIKFRNEQEIISICLQAFNISFEKKINEISDSHSSFSTPPTSSATSLSHVNIPSGFDAVRKDLLNQTSYPENTSEKPNYFISEQVPSKIPVQIEFNNKASSLKLIGQSRNRFLLAETDDALIVIDQHAAHERVLYEKTLEYQNNKQPVPTQQLLMPETMKVSFDDYVLIEEHIQIFNQSGFSISPFGKNTIKIDAIPSDLKNIKIQDYLSELIAYLKDSNSGKPGMEKIIRGICRHSVMFGDPLDILEQKKLINDLFKCKNPFSCPHGRPTLIKFFWNEIERKLGRT